MFDFIEHPLEPRAYIEKAVQLLRVGGLLAIWTPNGSAISAATDYVHLRIDLEHMQYLSYASCHHIAKEFGLDLVHLEGVGRAYLKDIELSLSEQRERKRVESATSRKMARRAQGALRRLRTAYRVVRYGSCPEDRDIQSLDDLTQRRDAAYHLFAVYTRNPNSA